MTPKQKAELLIEKYLGVSWNGDPDENFMTHFEAKKCALICVNEVLSAVISIADRKYDFWEEVKQEIEKL